MIPNATGSMPPPIPWITRATIRTPIEDATAASSEPTASAIERGHEDPLLADHVAEPSQDRRHDRRRQQVRGQHPRRGALRRVQLVLHRRQHRNHQRLQQRERRDANGQHRERHLVMRTPTSYRHQDLPEATKTFFEATEDLPEGHEDLPEGHEDLPEGHEDLPEDHEDLPETESCFRY